VCDQQIGQKISSYETEQSPFTPILWPGAPQCRYLASREAVVWPSPHTAWARHPRKEKEPDRTRLQGILVRDLLLWADTMTKATLFFFLIYLFYINVSTLLLSSDTPEEGIRSHYRWLWATMWLLEIELRNSGRAVSALNHWAISPAPSQVLGLKVCATTLHFSMNRTMETFLFSIQKLGKAGYTCTIR
jgi:hypothetical protein